MWMFSSLAHLILRLSKYFISLFSDPESDNHQKNQPKNHAWICSVAAETHLEISVFWSDLFSSSGNSPWDFCLLVFMNDAESDCPGRFPFSKSDRPSRFRRSIKTRNYPIERTHACTHTHVVIIYKIMCPYRELTQGPCALFTSTNKKNWSTNVNSINKDVFASHLPIT
jgi:hypothetical protein